MDIAHIETVQVLLAIAILIVAFGVGNYLSQHFR